ncbi:MAG: VOC family protein [Clostridia bacterium]|nr:VOC family protein [Clostridia bacterium]
MKINGVHHIAVYPNEANFEKTVTFYRDVLGFPLKRQWDDGHCQMLSCGDNTVMEIVYHPELDNAPIDGSLNHIAFATDDVDEIIEKVRALGYEVTIEPKDLTLGEGYDVRIAFFKGPLGETIELFKEY